MLSRAFYQRPCLPNCLGRLPSRTPASTPRPKPKSELANRQRSPYLPPIQRGGLFNSHTGRGGLLDTALVQKPRSLAPREGVAPSDPPAQAHQPPPR